MSDADRAARLRHRWLEYDAEYQRGEASRECVLAAYTDWVDAVHAPRHEAFEAREGGKMLRDIGIRTQEPPHD